MMKIERMEFYEMEILTNGALDIILGIIATLTSIALFFQPLPTFWRICQKKDTGGLLPYPYLLFAFSSVYWCMYAAPLTGTTIQFRYFCICCSSSFGCVLGGIYSFIFWTYCKDLHRFKFFALGMLIISLSWLFSPWWDVVNQGRNGLLGPIVILFGVMLYASPIFTVFDAMHTKRVDYLPFGLLRASCCNGFAWMVYACLPSDYDLCIAITHGFGTVFTIAQLGVAYEIQSFMTVCGKRTTECSVKDDEDGKLKDSAYTPLLDGSDSGKHNDEEYCRDDRVETIEHSTRDGGESMMMDGTTSSDVATASKVHLSINDVEIENKLKDNAYTPLLDGSYSGRKEYCGEDSLETIVHSTPDGEIKIVDGATSYDVTSVLKQPAVNDVEIENRPTSSSFPGGASFFGGVMERELEAKFNEFGLSAVMSYALASYFGGFHAALYVEKNMSKMIYGLRSENSELQQVNDKLNLFNDMLRESADKSHIKLTELLETVGKKGNEVQVKSKEFLEAVEEKRNEVKIKLKELLEAVGMEGDMEYEILQD